jgi:thiol-disulfide isomerase/thioredoxin
MNASYVPNKEFTKENDSDGTAADLYFFYTTWCPHCKTAKPVWDSFKGQSSSQTVKGVKINFIGVDCDKDKSTATQFNVTGYPTIKLVYNNNIVEYDAKPDVDTLQQFLESSL